MIFAYTQSGSILYYEKSIEDITSILPVTNIPVLLYYTLTDDEVLYTNRLLNGYNLYFEHMNYSFNFPSLTLKDFIYSSQLMIKDNVFKNIITTTTDLLLELRTHIEEYGITIDTKRYTLDIEDKNNITNLAMNTFSGNLPPVNLTYIDIYTEETNVITHQPADIISLYTNIFTCITILSNIYANTKGIIISK